MKSLRNYKNFCLIFLVFISCLYAAPNIFGSYPALHISGINNAPVNDQLITKIAGALKTKNISYIKLDRAEQKIVLCFQNPEIQLKAQDFLQHFLGDNYNITVNLQSAVPTWLNFIKASPMKLGLDLRGGVHFLLRIDIDSVIKQNIAGNMHKIIQELRANHIRYAAVVHRPLSIQLEFADKSNLNQAFDFLLKNYPNFNWNEQISNDILGLTGELSNAALAKFNNDTVEQVMTVLRNRVNELGIAEAVVQKQGASDVSIDLPGVQDTTQAKNILGKTATLEFHLVSKVGPNNDMGEMQLNDNLYDFHGQQLWLNNQIVLRGSSIVNADFGISEENGLPIVKIRLNGSGSSLFTKVTTENIGKPMAVVYVETKSQTKLVSGKPQIVYSTNHQIISAPIIQSPLGNNFQITGIKDIAEARDLALLLRAGSLPAPVTIISERQLGPSLGQQNIHIGMLSLVIGTLTVMLFMIAYYRAMGLIANIALLINLIMIVALLSILGATLTLSGIAGIVLTMGMAVDANVLIFERIREELRNGSSVKSSISLGYDKAFNAIFDANLTTLIVAVVLFSLGSGVVKGVAVTLTIGIITSMFTAVTITRAIVDWWYMKSRFQKLSIGI